MLKIAIVGNIASGKSTVEKIIQDMGFPVFDTDQIAHKILETSLAIKNEFNNLDETQRHGELKKSVTKYYRLYYSIYMTCLKRQSVVMEIRCMVSGA